MVIGKSFDGKKKNHKNHSSQRGESGKDVASWTAAYDLKGKVMVVNVEVMEGTSGDEPSNAKPT